MIKQIESVQQKRNKLYIVPRFAASAIVEFNCLYSVWNCLNLNRIVLEIFEYSVEKRGKRFRVAISDWMSRLNRSHASYSVVLQNNKRTWILIHLLISTVTKTSPSNKCIVYFGTEKRDVICLYVFIQHFWKHLKTLFANDYHESISTKAIAKKEKKHLTCN